MNLDGTNVIQNYVSSPASLDIQGACGVAVDGAHIYWADVNRNQIGRANLNGTEPVFSFIPGAREPCGVAVDSSHIYWSSLAGESIGRASLDGTGVDQGFIEGVKQPCGVAVSSFFIYWASPQEDSIGRALIGNGEAPRNDFISDANGACGVAIDSTHLFWGSFYDSIGRADLDGSNPSPAFISGLDRPSGLAVNGSRLFWTAESIGGGGRIGSANLDGTEINRDLLTGLSQPRGIAVDEQPFPLPRSPQPLQPSEFSFGKTKYSKRRSITYLAIDIATSGEFSIRVPRSVTWKQISSEPSSRYFSTVGRKWLAILPKESGAGRRLMRMISEKGRVRVPIIFSYTSERRSETTKRTQVTLLRKRSGRH